MDFVNEGHSVFFEIRALYVRDQTYRLIEAEGIHWKTITEKWDLLRRKRKVATKTERLEYQPGRYTEIIELDHDESEDDRLLDPAFDPLHKGDVVRFQELKRGSNDIIGVVSISPPKQKQGFDRRTWATLAFLYCSEFHVEVAPCKTDDREKEVCSYADKITELYEERLRITVANDEWNSRGRAYFHKRVRNYTRRMKRVEFCLPAFPCKSSNGQKTAGQDPDLAEAIALWTLQSFAAEVKTVYSPGARIWVVSDGHVFADCIGVDDAEVTRYNGRLKELNEKVNASCPSISFTSLPDAFFPDPAIKDLFQKEWVEKVDVPNLVGTEQTTEADLCRKLLMSCCQADSENLKLSIKDPESPILPLYRGFSRFMLEDLACHRLCASMSQSKRRKLSSTVAFEMIKRNQAYSNLVELIFPQHVRLSIHAHKNSGPKFGISLLPKQFVRPIRSLEDRLAPESEDLLHTPTPWHNCILRLEDDSTLYLVKSGIVKEAIESKEFGGEWVTPEGDDGCQGHFHLKKNSKKREAGVVAEANGSVQDEGRVEKLKKGSVYGRNEKIDIHLLKKEGQRLKMLAGGGAGAGAGAPAGTKTAAITATTTTADSDVRSSDGDDARSGIRRPVKFLQWAINRMFRIRLLRWLRSVIWARAKIDG